VTFLAPEQPKNGSAPKEQEQLFVPKQLVRQGEDGPFVWVADTEVGVARRATITTGRRGTSHLIEVLSGLTVTSKLIASPQEELRDGERIRIAGEDANFGVGPDSEAAQ
jgi:multidrug efflux pump subunit AcrA (membrane-fusion protein)